MPIKLNSASGGSVTLDVPATASTYTHTFPAETGTVLTTASTLNINASSISTGTLPRSRLPSGSIIQVVNTMKTDTFSSGTSETWIDLTGMSATITPFSSSSLIFVQIYVGRHYGTNTVVWRVLRNGGLYNAGAANGSRSQVHGAESNQGRDANHTGEFVIGYIDNPATTSAVTYQLQFRQEGTNFTFNRNGNYADNARSYDSVSSSSVILMEIAQ